MSICVSWRKDNETCRDTLSIPKYKPSRRFHYGLHTEQNACIYILICLCTSVSSLYLGTEGVLCMHERMVKCVCVCVCVCVCEREREREREQGRIQPSSQATRGPPRIMRQSIKCFCYSMQSNWSSCTGPAPPGPGSTFV